MPCFSCAVSTTVPLESRVTDYICLPLPFGWPYLYFARLFINTVFCLFRCLIPIIAVLFFWIATCGVLRNLILYPRHPHPVPNPHTRKWASSQIVLLLHSHSASYIHISYRGFVVGCFRSCYRRSCQTKMLIPGFTVSTSHQ